MTAPTINGSTYARRGGLLVPADVVPIRPDVRLDMPTPTADPAPVLVPTTVQVDDLPDVPDVAPEPNEPAERDERDRSGSVESLRNRLAAQRAIVEARREDQRARRRQEVEHRIALADVVDLDTDAKRERRDRTHEAREAADLRRYYQRAARSGARARVRADIDRSAEMRSLRVARVRTATLAVGLPALTAFAAWSTAGVQAGVVRLLGLDHGSAGWWAAWAMEPALMAIVALIIISRALLEASGGRTDERSYVVEWAALLTSIALNLAGGWNTQGGPWETLGGLLAHSVGPAGAAGVAYLIGLLLEYVAKAKPWDDAPRLAELNLSLPTPGQDAPDGPPEAINLRKLDPISATVTGGAEVTEELPEADRETLHAAMMAIESRALTPDPSGWAIYQRVMDGRGDKGRAYRVATLLRGWRPGQPTPTALRTVS